MSKIKQFITRHKKALIITALVLGGYYYYQSTQLAAATVTKYTLGTVVRDSLITTISGSGQVSPLNQVPVKPTANTQIQAVFVKVGQKVKKGDILVQLDDKQLKIQANNSRDSLAIARTNLQLKYAGVTPQVLALSQNSVDSAQQAYNLSAKSLATTQKTVQLNLQKAELALTNAQNQYNNSVSSQGINSTTDSDALINAYKGARITINSSYITMRTGLSFADSIINTTSGLKNVLGVLDSSALNDAKSNFDQAKSDFATFEVLYNSLGTNPTHAQLDNALNMELALAQTMHSLAHSVYATLLNTISSADYSQSSLDSSRSSAAAQESSMNSVVSNLQNSQQAISNANLGIDSGSLSNNNSLNSTSNNLASAQSSYNQAKIDAQKTLDQANADLANKKTALENAQLQYQQTIAKPRDIDVATMRLQIAQAQNNYDQALLNLAGARVVAPIDGTVAVVNASVGDYANNGNAASAATALVTVVTEKQLAMISLNEVDAAKVRVGQKVNVTFSAIDGLNITGEVTEVDLVGTVAQGVVSYEVQIAFDTQDPRVKPQMSVAATIITDQKLDTLVVPNTAVKVDNSGGSYVQIFDANASSSLVVQADGAYTTTSQPANKTVATGLANDTNTEILSGLAERDQIITKITTGTTAKTATTQSGGLGILGGGGNRGGFGGGRGN